MLSKNFNLELEMFILTFPEQGSGNYGWWAKAGLLSVFANKVSLAPGYTHSLIYCVWKFLRQDEELNSCDRDSVVFEA